MRRKNLVRQRISFAFNILLGIGAGAATFAILHSLLGSLLLIWVIAVAIVVAVGVGILSFIFIARRVILFIFDVGAAIWAGYAIYHALSGGSLGSSFLTRLLTISGAIAVFLISGYISFLLARFLEYRPLLPTILRGIPHYADYYPGLASPPTVSPTVSSEQVQFLAYHPASVAVEKWQTLLVYISLDSALEAVAANAAQFSQELGPYKRETKVMSRYPLTRGVAITIIPECTGATFNPPSQTLAWVEDWQRANFRFSAGKSLAGLACNGTISIYAGPIPIGTLKMAFLVDDVATLTLLAMPVSYEMSKPVQEVKGSMYQNLFVSYSHKDRTVVTTLRTLYRALGLKALIDVEDLRAGQVWNKELMNMIDTADIFQLFWSENASTSQYVKQEWMHALKCEKGEGFIRPVYWEEPIFPPPDELAHLHFVYLPKKMFYNKAYH